MAMAVNNDQHSPLCTKAQRNEPLFVGIGFIIGDGNRVIVFEHGSGFSETNSMLSEVGLCFLRVPSKAHELIVCTECTHRK